jgi:hypothetical protein
MILRAFSVTSADKVKVPRFSFSLALIGLTDGVHMNPARVTRYRYGPLADLLDSPAVRTPSLHAGRSVHRVFPLSFFRRFLARRFISAERSSADIESQ